MGGCGRLGGDGVSRHFRRDRLRSLLPLARPARPNVESAVGLEGALGDFPRAPDAFSLAEASIKNVMRANVTLGPVTLAVGGIISAFDEKAADVVVAVS